MFGSDTSLIPLQDLLPHENVDLVHVRSLAKKIQKSGRVKPIIVDKESHMIIDGHHRVRALRLLNYSMAPVYFVDYFGSSVRVYMRRKELLAPLLKKAVVQQALQNKQLPIKTTRHYISNRPNHFISLQQLKRLKKKGGENL